MEQRASQYANSVLDAKVVYVLLTSPRIHHHGPPLSLSLRSLAKRDGYLLVEADWESVVFWEHGQRVAQKSGKCINTTLVVPTLNPSTWAKRPVSQEELFAVSITAPS